MIKRVDAIETITVSFLTVDFIEFIVLQDKICQNHPIFDLTSAHDVEALCDALCDA